MPSPHVETTHEPEVAMADRDLSLLPVRNAGARAAELRGWFAD